MKNRITEMKNILVGIYSRLDEKEDQISNLKDKAVETTQSAKAKKKGIKKMRVV